LLGFVRWLHPDSEWYDLQPVAQGLALTCLVAATVDFVVCFWSHFVSGSIHLFSLVHVADTTYQRRDWNDCTPTSISPGRSVGKRSVAQKDFINLD
jgi:hypothetical protein